MVIEGQDPWRVPASPEDGARMEGYVTKAESRGAEGRCSSCAFRRGTIPNGSRLVVHSIDACLLTGGTFMCHMAENTPCVGYNAIRGVAKP